MADEHTILAGVDIGGTKCAVVLGRATGDHVEVIAKRRFPTPPTPAQAQAQCETALADLLPEHHVAAPVAIGISCGSPLDSHAGLILSPPNLPGWDRIDLVSPLRDRFDAPTALQNDANACALAEWQWGAGRGTRNMIFLTFGTGMGVGLILDGKLYSGTNDMAGEVGHVRLEWDGPEGYGKRGSFEGFCSGGGSARLARKMVAEAITAEHPPSFSPTAADLDTITAATVGRAAQMGDPLALDVWRIVAQQLGRGLAMLVDILNPQRIVIGSIWGRQQALLEPLVFPVLRAEALPHNLSVCQIVSAELGEQIGDLASLAIAMNTLRTRNE